MSDTPSDLVYAIAESQAGYFTSNQAIDAGMDRSTLAHHARPGGRYERSRRGLYRLRHFPSSRHEHIVSAWLPLRAAGAIVSHESALQLWGLSDVIPDAIHVSLSRAKRGVRARVGVKVHTVTTEIPDDDVRTVDGIPVTSPERSLLDSLESGAQPEQIELGMRQALSRGMTTPARLAAIAEERTARARSLVTGVVQNARA